MSCSIQSYFSDQCVHGVLYGVDNDTSHMYTVGYTGCPKKKYNFWNEAFVGSECLINYDELTGA